MNFKDSAKKLKDVADEFKAENKPFFMAFFQGKQMSAEIRGTKKDLVTIFLTSMETNQNLAKIIKRACEIYDKKNANKESN